MIRLATATDLPAIDNIYNQAVKRGFCTAHLKPMSSQERTNWYRQHTPENNPVYVFEKNQKIMGWLSLSPYRPGREALNEVAEISFYVDFDFHGQNIGSKLVDHCLKKAPLLNKRIYFAIIIEGNKGSISLLEKFRFEKRGCLPEAVNYKGEKRDQIYMGKILR